MGTQDDLDQDDSSFLDCYTSSFSNVFSYGSRENHVLFLGFSNGGNFLASNSGNREP
jgi:predicted esterase